jgi:DNA-binding response OmpR family regulator
MTKKILIVDDEPNIVLSLEFLMKHSGYAVTTAYDGEEALAAIKADQPDLMLLDVMMPKLNGFAVCQAVRENPDWQAMRVIMVTAKGRDIEFEKGVSLGADAYITKPFSAQELLDKVAELLGE